MKRNYLFLWGNTQIGKGILSFCLCVFLIGITSCSEGFDDNERFSGGVTGVTLESPTLDESCFATLVNSDGTESVKVTWPVVYGAGGYVFSVNNVNDPSNSIVVVSDSIIDGCSGIFSRLEDTRYEVSVKSLANEKLDNKEATSATVYAYSTLLPAKTIPEGQEIAKYIEENIDKNADGEQGFELLAGKTYHLNGTLNFGLKTVTFRGDKVNRPTVILGPDGEIETQAGLKLKFINFDCTQSTKEAFLNLSANPSEEISIETLGYKKDGADRDGYVINNPIIIQECNLKNLNKSLLYGNKKAWSLRDFRIVDCIMQLNNEKSTFIRLDDASPNNGLIKSLTVKNNTFYNLLKNSSGYFIRYTNASNAQPRKVFGNSGNSASFTIEYNTFSHVMSNKDLANNMPTVNTFTINLQYNIFYDVFRLYQMLVNNTKKNTAGNTIFGVWGGTPNGNDTGGRKDDNGNPYATLEDPEFVGPFEVEFDLTKANGGVNFTPRGSIAVDNKAGDPRWYE